MTTSAPQWPGQEGSRQQDEIRNPAARPALVQRTPAQATPVQMTTAPTAPLRAAGPGAVRRLQPVPELPGGSEGWTRQEQQQRRRVAARRNRFLVVRDPAERDLRTARRRARANLPSPVAVTREIALALLEVEAGCRSAS